VLSAEAEVDDDTIQYLLLLLLIGMKIS